MTKRLGNCPKNKFSWLAIMLPLGIENTFVSTRHTGYLVVILSNPLMWLDGRMYFYFAHVKCHIPDSDSTVTHETEHVFAAHQSHFDVHSIQHQSILKAQIQMRSPDQHDLFAGQGRLLPLLEAFVLWCMIIHVSCSVFAPQTHSQVGFFGSRSITQKGFQVSSIGIGVQGRCD